MTEPTKHAIDMVDGLVEVQQGEYADQVRIGERDSLPEFKASRGPVVFQEPDAVKVREPVEPTREEWKLRALAAEEALAKVQSILNVAKKLTQALEGLDR